MKKIIAFILAVLMLVLLLSSCGTPVNTDTQAADSNTKTEDKIDNEDTDTEASETDTESDDLSTDVDTSTDTQESETSTDTADTSTDTSTDTQAPESSDTESNKDKQLYSQIKGGEPSENIGDSKIVQEDKIKVNYSPYRLIYTYDELLELTENASEIDSTIFEENVILYVKQRYSSIWGEPVGYSDFKIENGELFITYSKYMYSLETAAEAIMHYNDYIVIPKSELPRELEKAGTISVIINLIELYHMEGGKKVDEMTMPLNSAWILRTKDEVNEFASTYNITDKAFPYSNEVVVAIYMKRPQKVPYMNESQNTHQGYLAEVNGTNLKITYLYDENNAGETEYYIDFIILPKEMLDGIEEIEVTLEPRLEPVPNVAKEYDN